ncbi:MAG: hypothetical protein U5L74_00615 [Ideonella sp.]|nr:hypothetical protein [Ideonella sp.]
MDDPRSIPAAVLRSPVWAGRLNGTIVRWTLRRPSRGEAGRPSKKLLAGGE